MTPNRQLTVRELQVLKLAFQGYGRTEIGKRLGISMRTVEVHRYNIYRKWNVRSIVELVHRTYQLGLANLFIDEGERV